MASNKNAELQNGLQRAIDAVQSGRRKEAISLLEVLAAEFPRSAKVWGYLGFLNKESGRLPQAIRSFQKVVKLSPQSELASMGLFHSLWRDGDSDKAFREMRRFMRRGEPHKYLELLRDMLSPSGNSKKNGSSILTKDELRMAVKEYRSIEQRPEKLIPVITGAGQLLELVHA